MKLAKILTVEVKTVKTKLMTQFRKKNGSKVLFCVTTLIHFRNGLFGLFQCLSPISPWPLSALAKAQTVLFTDLSSIKYS